MEIIREFRKSRSNKLVLNIPDAFRQRELEILIIPVKEEPIMAKTSKRKYNRKKIDKKDVIYDDLTYLAGTWTETEAEDFQKATEHFNQIDENLWQ